MYEGKSCYNLIKELGVIKKGILISPISFEPLSVKMFEIKHAIDISHNIAVCKNKIIYCPNNNILLSDYRPGNLFWDTHLCNMQQQDFTITEYWQELERRMSKRAEMLE